VDDAPVHHPADVAARCQDVGRERPVDEVEIRRTRVLVQAERHLELAVLKLRLLELLVVQKHVAPGIFVVADLALDLKVGVVADLSLDADPPPCEIERSVCIVAQLDVDVRTARVELQPCAESHLDDADLQRRMRDPAEHGVFFLRLLGLRRCGLRERHRGAKRGGGVKRCAGLRGGRHREREQRDEAGLYARQL
jgi:hypothetical protein